MTSQRGKRQAALAPQIEEDRGMTGSPARILILCIAVLVISASGGVLIGNLLNRAEEKPLMEVVSAFILPPSTQDAIVAIEPSPFESNDYPEESPFASNDYPKELSPEAHIAALKVKEAETGIAAIEPDLFPKARQVPIEPLTASDPPWRKYAALAPPFEGKPLIALVIDDVGLSQGRVEELSGLPGLMTLAFLPYASKLQSKAEYARERGHEIMLHLPMEPMDHGTNPGPDALLLGLTPEELTRRVKKNLDSFDGYVGVNNHMGSRFTANSDAMSLVMDILAERGLLFLDSKTTASSVGYRFAVSRGMPSAKRDIFIDNVIEEEAILKQLKKVEDISSRKGLAIAIGHPHKATMSVLRTWLPEARKRGFVFVPISAVMALKYDG
jgi:polysaccharide deacetylase 2 family uncharacterized protein YibQ